MVKASLSDSGRCTKNYFYFKVAGFKATEWYEKTFGVFCIPPGYQKRTAFLSTPLSFERLGISNVLRNPNGISDIIAKDTNI